MQQPLPLTPLTAISPVDGRYAHQTEKLRRYFSEYAVIKERVTIELLYLQALSQHKLLRKLSNSETKKLSSLSANFNLTDAKRIKEIEQTTRHDVKAIEYFLKEKLDNSSLADVVEMIHFGVTSEDISNLAVARLTQNAVTDVIALDLKQFIITIIKKAENWKALPMLARTHGKDAPATTAGKEFALFAHRLAKKYEKLTKVTLTGKLTGVVGNFHELSFATDLRVTGFSKAFVQSLKLEPQIFTTQIEPHDRISELFHLLSEISGIIKSFDQNMWLYISHNYFSLPPKKGQIGSSVMPHKGRNPIGFENSEGNAILASALFDTLASELPNSRLQRHLSDSTMLRNVGVGFGYLLLCIENAANDIVDLQANNQELIADLENKWAIVTAPLQTKLRLLGIKGAYEIFDKLAKSGNLNQESIQDIIRSIKLDKKIENELLSLSPTYFGKAEELTEMMIGEINTLL